MKWFYPFHIGFGSGVFQTAGGVNSQRRCNPSMATSTVAASASVTGLQGRSRSIASVMRAATVAAFAA
jgi:hypothetical protein